MRVSKSAAIAIAAISASMAISGAAQAADLVTYTWTTTSQGFGLNLGQPTASFQVPLADVLAGKISQFDVTNIQMTYTGLTFDNFTTSSGGFDFAGFVNPVTGAFIYHDADQGFSVFAYKGNDVNNATTWLSITVDAVASTPSGQLLTSVKDQFNAFKNGGPDAGFPTAGFWTASFPQVSSGAPEPASWAMMIAGFAGMGAMLRRRHAKALA